MESWEWAGAHGVPQDSTVFCEKIHMIDIAPDWMLRILEMRKNPEIANKDDVQKLADDFILLLYSGKPNTNMIMSAIKNAEEYSGETVNK